MIPLTIHYCNLKDFEVFLFISLRQNMDSKLVKVYIRWISDLLSIYRKPQTLLSPYQILSFPPWQGPAGKMTRKVARKTKPAIKVFRKTFWYSGLVVKGSSKFWVDTFTFALVMLLWLGEWCLLCQSGNLAFHLLEIKRN